MLERERREDQADRLVILPTARGHSARGAGRIMKSPREVLIRPIALSLAAILFTTVLVAEVYSHATALHVRDPEDLALALDPIPRASRAIGRAKLHGCDAFEAKLQAWAQGGRAIALDMLIEPDAGAGLGHDRCERSLADPALVLTPAAHTLNGPPGTH